jgi:hypothetical protein
MQRAIQGQLAEAHFSVRRSFVVKDGDLDRLRQILTPWETIAISAACRDHVTRHFDSLLELANFENDPLREIQELTISARSTELGANVRIKLNGATYIEEATVHLRIDGPEGVVTQIRIDLEAWLEGVRPWYSWVSAARVWFFGWGALGILAAVALTTRGDEPDLFAWIQIGLGTAGLTAFPLGLIQRRFFPLAVFALGQGKSRFEKSELVRQLVIVGFLVSLVSGLMLIPIAMVFS